jgi:aldose 1-epimerase
LEPVEVMTDAFNRPDCQAAITLPPEEKRSFRCGVDIAEPASQP